jgi:butyrate kinase
MLFLKTVRHVEQEFDALQSIDEQVDYRLKIVLEELKNADIRTDLINAIISRGGLLKPISAGIYEINDAMVYDLQHGEKWHEVNLGSLIAHRLTDVFKGAKAYTADPVVVDEMDDVARFTGLPQFKRKSIFHALNHKAQARKYAKAVMKRYEDLNVIVGHLGDGISIGAHRKGRVVDVNQTLDGGGAFSLERAGSLPEGDLVSMCFSGQYTEDEILELIKNDGGMKAYIGTSDLHDIEFMIANGDKKVIEIFEAMAYQVSKYIGSMSVVLNGDVDAVILTGNIAYNQHFTNYIIEKVKFIAPVVVYPGECLAEALSNKVLGLMSGELQLKEYV